ncbi:NAD(P)/FAD-dependent oxidoreductase [Amycolatopsis sp. lyj-23]|uniref:NAD(P)/FAD-dependent oxidoreductase n=1 Tax=Amycolatopsis sp. lyj-23 TaxID=2789283 RepID=UPI00397B945F
MKQFDVIVVGGGPAGASCAVWLKNMGHKPCIVERRSALGGLENDNPYVNDLIVPLTNWRGEEIAAGIHDNVLGRGIFCLLNTAVESVRQSAEAFVVNEGLPSALSARYLVLASGVRPADGGLLPGSRVLIGPGAPVEEVDFRSLSVAVLGGGDNAFENYHIIKAKQASEVRIFARTIKAAHRFRDPTPVSDVHVGPYEVDTTAMTVSGQPFDLIVVLYGWAPAIDFAHGLGVERDPRGFVVTDPATTETSVRNVFAIGEVAHRMHPCSVTAMADGVVAGREIQQRLDARAKETYLALARQGERNRKPCNEKDHGESY